MVGMNQGADPRRSAALELEKLVAEFERSDEAAFRRSRILSWIVTSAVTIILIVLLAAGADWRYLGAFWLAILALTWGAYGLSIRRQRQQLERLRALTTSWLVGT